MNLASIFHRFSQAEPQVAGVGLVGAGQFGATFIAQIRRMSGVRMVAICDQNPRLAVETAIEAGFDKNVVKLCTDLPSAQAHAAQGHLIVVERTDWLVKLPLVAVLEATGDPQAAAATALSCIEAGRHVVLATKEAEIVVGAELARLAEKRGVVVSPVDGDQPSLLIGLIEWARLLGLPVVAAGKASESDFVWDPASNQVQAWGRQVAAPAMQRQFIASEGIELSAVLKARAELPFELTTVPDLCEMGIVANHTGLMPDCSELHAPLARTVELPTIFRPRTEGGILSGAGRVDMFNCLRRPDELSFAGGVFVVIEAPDKETGRLFAAKGMPTSEDGRYVLVHNPVHLLGAEAAMSILSSVKLHCSTGSRHVRPLVDLVGITDRALMPGEVLALGTRHVISGLRHRLEPARPLGEENPLPYYMCVGAKVRHTVPAGRVLLGCDLDVDRNTPLYQLRESQDKHFLGRA